MMSASRITKPVPAPLASASLYFGRIAEQYGENDAAASDYRRVEKPEDTEPLPISTYRLAQNRLKGLPAAGVRSAK